MRPRTLEAYEMTLRLLARWAEQDPAELGEEWVRENEGSTGVPTVPPGVPPGAVPWQEPTARIHGTKTGCLEFGLL